MATVITHFHNEERMLQWWLPHHRKLFRHGILIDRQSTDRSLDVCRDLAPDWQIVPTRLRDFDALDNDFEVMSLEASVADGWKAVLNTTEFLVCPDFEPKLEMLEEQGKHAFKTKGVCMVDPFPENVPDPGISLIRQKHHGYVERRARWKFGSRLTTLNGKRARGPYRERIVHRYMTGAYTPGRHGSNRFIDGEIEGAFVLWYGFSPWGRGRDHQKASVHCPRFPNTTAGPGWAATIFGTARNWKKTTGPI